MASFYIPQVSAPQNYSKQTEVESQLKGPCLGRPKNTASPLPHFSLTGLALNLQLFIASATKIHTKVHFSYLVSTTIRNLRKLTVFGKHNSGVLVNARDFFST